MERFNLSPFPEIEELKKAIPDTGIAFHGTTRDNAEKILEEGFKMKHPYRIKHLNYMHFFYIPPRGIGYSNTHSSYEGFNETLSWAHLRGNVHEPNGLHQQAIVIFQPDLAESEVIISDEPEKRFEKGHPIWIRTQKTSGHKIIGISEFAMNTNSTVNVNRTVEKMTQTLKKANNPFLKPQSPAQA